MILASADIKLLLYLLRVNDAVLDVVSDLVENYLGNRLLVGLVVHDLQSSLFTKGLSFNGKATATNLCAVRTNQFIHGFVVTGKDEADDKQDAPFAQYDFIELHINYSNILMYARVARNVLIVFTIANLIMLLF